ncbi:MAG TPA: DNA-3-methyladenine glycosylase I [Anaeromyxobacter sp.]|nr:DNA-3-methyladenine glycosylase I [Anaeromyxobacter sp.]
MPRLPRGVAPGPDGRLRCGWCLSSPDYITYHDEEWGFPVADEAKLFEKLCLEGFQSGLSWLTILRKRPAFRREFEGFDPARVARFGPRRVEQLLQEPSIVRHRGKIEAAIGNARRALELRREVGSLAAHLWSFEPKPRARPRRLTWAVLRAIPRTPESTALSRDLRRRGFRFVGPTTAYAFMQAMGLVNDHLEGCSVRPRVERARRAFLRPKGRLPRRT